MHLNNPQSSNKREASTIDNIYNTIDDLLIGLRDGRITNLIEHQDKVPQAIADMEHLGLITYQKPSDKRFSLVDITHQGLSIINNGGIGKYYSDLEHKEKTRDELLTRELQKVHLEIEDLVNKVADYDRVKSQAKWALIFAGISTAAAIGALLRT